MEIKVLGSGCSKCVKLQEQVQEVLAELNINRSVKKVTDIAEIMQYGVMRTPALVIDEKVVVSGRVPSKEELKEIFKKLID
jgi:small redox-active disulfide protein 2